MKPTNLGIHTECACAGNQNLRGAAVNAYISRFLKRTNPGTPAAVQFICRICGARWRSGEQSDSARPQLIRTKDTSGGIEE